MSVFNRIGPARVGRSMFNIGYDKLFTCDMGELIPCYQECVVPGDILQISTETVVRLMPTVAPILHEVNVYEHFFFVPYRILWSSWESFITGGEDGADASTLPTWSPSDVTVGSMWDYLEMVAGVTPDADSRPVFWPLYCYNQIFNDYYRDEMQTSAVSLSSETLQHRAWEKDYFTTCRDDEQLGTPPALGLANTVEVDAIDRDITIHNESDATARTMQFSNPVNVTADTTPSASNHMRWSDPAMEVDLTGATLDVSQIRLAFSIQKWMERNARAGARYTEFITAHFGRGVAPRDERLDRAEYIGGCKSPVIIQETRQTSETNTTPQSNLTGNGLAMGRKRIGRYRVKEYGIVMGILSVMPRSKYYQGIDRQWLRSTKYDYFHPEFANLSEQAVLRREIYLSGVKSENETVFGYQGRYNEMRSRMSKTCGEMRYGSNFDHWHLGRHFSSAPALNPTFIYTDDIRKDPLASSGDPALMVHIGNHVLAARPIPIVPVPGFLDH